MSLKDFALALSADTDPQLFLGDETARDSYLAKMAKAMDLYREKASGAPFAADAKLFMDDEDENEFELPRGVQITPNGTALLKISGELAPSVGFFGRLMGMMGYSDIINAMAELSENPQVKRTLLMINSSGGTANGIEAVAEVLQRADRVKPVYTFTDSQALSAAYWIGMQGRRFYASKTSRVGSIGVVTVHKEVTKAMQEQGISVEVLRAGKFKAIGNPFEKLTEEARGIILNDLQTMYGFFLEAVTDARGMTRQTLVDQAAEGRVFFGEEAKKVNLVDDVLSLSAVLSRIERGSGTTTGTKNQPAPAGNVRSSRGFSAMKKVRIFSRQAQQMLAEGADTTSIVKALGEDKAYELISIEDAKAQGVSYTDEHLVEVDDEGNTSPAASDTGGETGTGEGTTPAPSDGQPAGEQQAGPAGGGEPGATPPAAAAPVEDTGVFQARLMDLMETNATLKVENAGLKNQVQKAQAVSTEMQSIVIGRIQAMQVGLNMSPISDDVQLSAEALVALHNDVHARFTKAFNVGQRSKSPAGERDNASSKAPAGPAQAASRVSMLGRPNGR